MKILPRGEGGLYVSLEGIEGVGKSYYLESIVARAEDPNVGVPARIVPAVEISRSGLGAEVTEVLRKHDDEFFRCGFPLSEALVFFSMKLFELEQRIMPALAKGFIVVEDRSVDSNCAYAAVQLEAQHGVRAAEAFTTLLSVRESLAFIPDVTILLLDDVEACITRASSRTFRTLSPSESEFVRAIDAFFRELAAEGLPRISPLDLSATPLEQRADLVWRHLLTIYEKRNGGK